MISKQDIYIITIEKLLIQKKQLRKSNMIYINEAERVVLFFLLFSYTHMTFSCLGNGLRVRGDKNR